MAEPELNDRIQELEAHLADYRVLVDRWQERCEELRRDNDHLKARAADAEARLAAAQELIVGMMNERLAQLPPPASRGPKRASRARSA